MKLGCQESGWLELSRQRTEQLTTVKQGQLAVSDYATHLVRNTLDEAAAMGGCRRNAPNGVIWMDGQSTCGSFDLRTT